MVLCTKPLIVSFHSCDPFRVAQGFPRLFEEKLGIPSEFSYKTKERGYDPERTEKLLDEVLSIMNKAGNPEEKIFSTDVPVILTP